MAKDLFRKVSIERLSSPEQLDKLLIIVKIRGWIALVTILMITAAILVWSFTGHIPISATGKGILLDPRGLHGVFSTVQGRVTNISGRTGSQVKKGELLITLDNKLLYIQRDDLNEKITAIERRLKDEETLFAEEKVLKQEEYKRKKEIDAFNLENLKAQLALLEKQLKETPSEERESLEQKIIDQRSLIQSQLTEMNIFQSQQRIEQKSVKIDDIKFELTQAQAELRRVQSQIDDLTIETPYDGRIIEIDVMLGREIVPGTPLIWIQEETEKGSTLPFYTFVPVAMGEKIKPGMKAQIDLVAIDAQKYGQIVGEVSLVLPYAASISDQQLAGIPSRVLREYLQAGPTAILVILQPKGNPNTPSGYQWTTPKGPPDRELPPGAIGEARIILESKRPISYVLPILTDN